MNEDDFEGSLVLEMLAEHGLVDEFLEAVDSDNISRILSLMRKADIDDETIEITLKKIRESHFKH
jgi:predicted AAA+ superfamily ATPase